MVEGALIRPCHAVSFFAVDRNLNLAVAFNKMSEAHSVFVLEPNNSGLIYLVEEHDLYTTRSTQANHFRRDAPRVLLGF